MLKYIPLILVSALVSCAAPPYMVPKIVSATQEAPSPTQATLVILRPFSSCERGGHYVVVDESGRLHGSLISDSALETSLSAGAHTLYAWNPRREEVTKQDLSDIAVLPMQLEPKKIYYVLLGFSLSMDGHQTAKWGYRHRIPIELCGKNNAELHPLGPERPFWDYLASWQEETKAYVVDPTEARAWESSNRLQISEHIEHGNIRLSQFGEPQLRLRSLAVSDGSPR